MNVSSVCFSRITVVVLLAFLFAACRAGEEYPTSLEEGKKLFEQLKSNPDFMEYVMPDPYPGPPGYTWISTLPEWQYVLETNGKVFIPFVRKPGCTNKDFNLLELFDTPSCYECALTVTGSLLIEKNATRETMPAISYTKGKSDMEMWIVDSAKLKNAMADGKLTIGELESLGPLKATGQYEEYFVPRSDIGEMLLIEASGTVASTNQKFSFSYVEKNRKQVSISLTLN
jgi:hypothetical protein